MITVLSLLWTHLERSLVPCQDFWGLEGILVSATTENEREMLSSWAHWFNIESIFASRATSAGEIQHIPEWWGKHLLVNTPGELSRHKCWGGLCESSLKQFCVLRQVRVQCFQHLNFRWMHFRARWRTKSYLKNLFLTFPVTKWTTVLHMFTIC